MAMCTKLSKRVHDLEKEKDDQAVEILKLKKRVKKLERQRKSSISHLRRRIYRYGNVEGEIVYATYSEVSTEEQLRPNKTPPPSQPSDTRDKGKGIMVEPDPPVKIKRSDQGDLQLQADAELAQLMHQEELTQVERRQRERAAQEEAFIAALYEEYILSSQHRC
ncbi:hypothetical protein Tco_1090258 [Tanacetum coccineum]|uniref:Uncharacterized protein n=1 Tax=Tanacetum coccineum TaxID=301880 RepID=A0ABQ5I519_9ASTR